MVAPTRATETRTSMARVNVASAVREKCRDAKAHTSEVAVCCSSDSVRAFRVSASSRVRASSCAFNSAVSELGSLGFSRTAR